ncbi:UPF0643 protein [Cercospora beticola]|uniref:UPF0643 protein n=2 Tax=Cercospora beticola TaxID=122368 RepID=A0A2G5H8E8_CERBT|nr:UPF0643 protein [Cercospora beticola]PIA88801.1 UPF0643 protein [Cercospora beticola]
MAKPTRACSAQNHSILNHNASHNTLSSSSLKKGILYHHDHTKHCKIESLNLENLVPMATLVQAIGPDNTQLTAATNKEDFSHVEVIAVNSAASSPPTRSPVSKAVDDSNGSDIAEDTLLSTTQVSPVLTPLDLNATHLISSPYDDFANQLTLHDLETPYRLFAFALTALKPIREDYATAPYLESFNWSEVFALLRELCKQERFEWKELSFYTVIFRSTLLPGIDRDRLGLLDQMSHQEACASGGLLKYWFGSCDGELRNLATCLWRSREDAAAGGGGPWHAQARAAARTMYKQISFHTHRLVVEDGATSWRLDAHVEERPRR